MATDITRISTPAEPPREPADLVRLHVDLVAQVGQARDFDEAVRHLLRAAKELTNAAAIAYFDQLPAAKPMPAALERTDGFQLEGPLVRIAAALRRVFAERRGEVLALDEPRGLTAVLTPVVLADGTTHALAAILLLGDEPLEPFVVILQLIAGYLTLAGQRSLGARSHWEAQSAAAILELTTRLLEARSARAAAFTLAHEIQRHLQVQEVAIGVGRGSRFRLEAISGKAEVDGRTEQARQYQTVFQEAVLKQEATVWCSDSGRPATEAHRRLCDARRAKSIYSAPLVHAPGGQSWAWVVLSEAPLSSDAVRWLEAAGPHAAAALALLAASRRLSGPATVGRRWWWLALAAVVGVCSLAPVPFRLHASSVAEPTARRFVAAPFESTLAASSVHPGDLVAVDQVLARLDDRELQTQLTEAIAERASAEKRAKAALARQEVAEAQVAQLEAERLSLRIALFERRLGEIELKSPIAGRILSGDWDRAIGVPVRVGQTLFEIAPLDHMRIELEISDDDVALARPGAAVELWFDSLPESFTGVVASVRPQAEIRDSQNVFVAEVDLANADGQLRPGLRGSARIDAGWQPAWWVLLRKPWHLIRRWWW